MSIYAISSVAKFEFDFVVVVIIFGGSAARSTTTTMAKFHKKNYCWADFRFRRLDRSRFIFIISILALFTLLNTFFFEVQRSHLAGSPKTRPCCPSRLRKKQPPPFAYYNQTNIVIKVVAVVDVFLSLTGFTSLRFFYSTLIIWFSARPAKGDRFDV